MAFNFLCNKRYAEFALNAMDSHINIIHGVIRTGKDYLQTILFVERIRAYKGTAQMSLIGAVNSKLAYNIVGQYILDYCGNRAKRTKSGSADAIEIKLNNGKSHFVLFAEGCKVNSASKIRGLTLAGVYLTEINELNEDFIDQAFARLTNDGRKAFFFGTANPKDENHWFYRVFEDQWKAELVNDDRYCNWMEVTIYDKPDFTIEQCEEFLSGKDPNSVSYKRDYLGLRVGAAGKVYTLTDENIINNIDNIYSEYIIVVDTGVTISATTMLALGLCYNTDTKQKELHVLREYYHLNGGNIDAKFKSDDDYAKDIAKFTHDMKDAIKKVPTRLYYDGTSVMKTKIQRELRSLQLGNINPMFVIKDALKDRLVDSQNMIYSNQIKILDTCKHLIQEIKTAEYDDKEFDKSGEVKIKKAYNTEGHLDCIDVLQYGISYYTKNKKV